MAHPIFSRSMNPRKQNASSLLEQCSSIYLVIFFRDASSINKAAVHSDSRITWGLAVLCGVRVVEICLPVPLFPKLLYHLGLPLFSMKIDSGVLGGGESNGFPIFKKTAF